MKKEPEAPLCRALAEDDYSQSKKCPICSSSLKARITFPFRCFITKRCVHEKCSNYYDHDENDRYKYYGYAKFKKLYGE